jgi:hypothetical protein
MKTIRYTIILCSIALVTSCSLFNKPKYGCGTNGKNVGAEKVLDGTAPKAKKFKA